VIPADIRNTALLTIEGLRDDISPVGHTTAAHDLTTGLKTDQKFSLFADAGHYGIFSGSTWRRDVAPFFGGFVREIGSRNGVRYDAPPEEFETRLPQQGAKIPAEKPPAARTKAAKNQ
jgi:poly(3-hydroxybutyrate) depolymerase